MPSLNDVGRLGPSTTSFDESTHRNDAKMHHEEGTSCLWWKLSMVTYHNLRVMGSNLTCAKVACSCTAKSKTLGKITPDVVQSPDTEVSGNKNSGCYLS